MSGIFGSRTIKGTRITDFSETTATVGTVIPFGYGRFTSGGNVIWAPLPPKEHRHTQRVGKGGTRQESFTYTLSYAVAFAKGPIAGYWWIKRNGKVVYTQDPNAPIEDHEYAAKWLERATLYYGTMEQLPDSTIESYEGTGEVSAFHRLAYIVVEDDDVTDGGGAVPTYEACVIADGISYATSPPYVLESTVSYDADVELGRLQNTNTTALVGSYGNSVEFGMLENRLMRIVESGPMGGYGVGVEFGHISNKLARVTESSEMGGYGVGVEFGIIQNDEIRVVLDRHEPMEYGVSVEFGILENIIP